MIRSALASTHRRMTLFYANRDTPGAIFAAEIAALARGNPDRLTVHMHYDDADGFPERGKVAALLSSVAQCQLYLCGPEAIHADRTGSSRGGRDGARARPLERFDAPMPNPEAGSATRAASSAATSAVECDAKVILGGALHVVRVASGQSLLQAALACGVDAPYACEEGYCGSCAAKCIDGAVVHERNDVFGADELAAGWILTCQARPRQERPVAITYDV
ncbi:2Fe-2S iron-sulfur cluster-binding protein [Cupriavidus basilensis]